MQPPRVIRRVKAKAECSTELDPGNKHELPIFATPSCASAPGLRPISRQSKKEMDKFGGKFLQHQRFSCCDPWEDGHQLMPMHHRQPAVAPSTPSPGNLAPTHLAASTQPLSPTDPCKGSGRENSHRHHLGSPEVVCPSLPSSRICLPGTRLPAQQECHLGAKRVKCGGEKRQKSSIHTRGQARWYHLSKKLRGLMWGSGELSILLLKPVPSSVPQSPHL